MGFARSFCVESRRLMETLQVVSLVKHWKKANAKKFTALFDLSSEANGLWLLSSRFVDRPVGVAHDAIGRWPLGWESITAICTYRVNSSRDGSNCGVGFIVAKRQTCNYRVLFADG